MQPSSITIALVTLTLVSGCASDDNRVHGRAADHRAAAGSSAAASVRRDEMLVNGDFANGTANWVVEESGATGRAECVKEGPGGKASLRLTVVTVGDKAWRLQLYHVGFGVEKGRTYDLTFWAGSDRAGSITVNCMQNHAPWDHHTQIILPVSTEWKQLCFT